MFAIDWETILPPWLGEALPLGVIVTDAELCIRYWSPWMAERSGLSARFAVGRAITDLVAELTPPELAGYYERALAGETVTLRQREHGYLLPLPAPPNSAGLDLMQQRAVISPLRAEGRVIGTLTILTDLTDRAAQDLQLKQLLGEQDETLALLDTLITKAPIGFAFIDPELRFRGINERLAEINGVPVAEHLGRTIFEIVPGLADQQTHLFLQVIASGQPLTNIEIVGETRARPGEERIWQVSYYPVQTASQRLLGVGVLVAEVTEERRVMAAAERSRVIAEQAVQVRDAFFSIAAHELRTPLTTLLGRAQLLQKWMSQEQGVNERNLRSVQIVVEQAQRLNRMISSLLDVSRIQSGRFAIEPAPLDLAALVRRVVDETRATITTHTLELHEAEGPLRVSGDEVRLEQVLQNLISNAVKYSPAGDPVLIEVGRSGSDAVLAVSDRGIGIPAEAQGLLFKRFYRAENAERLGVSGLGIGLFVINEIVELHGGSIAVASAEGQGSTFTVRLPLV